MLYEFNDKIYVKPFVNKIVEVKITKTNDGFDVQPTTKQLELNNEIKEKMVQISLENAYKIYTKADKKI